MKPEFTKVSELFAFIDWELDGNGLTITDGRELARAIADYYDDLEWDMSFPYDESEENDDESALDEYSKYTFTGERVKEND